MNRKFLDYIATMLFLIASAAGFSGKTGIALGFLSIGFFIVGIASVFDD